MYCKECGFQLSDDAKFCPNCGTKVEQNGIGNIKQKAVFGKIEKDDEAVDLKSINKQAQWSSLPNDLYNEQRKIICTKKTTDPKIFIKYFRYDNDTSELSPQWYVDEKQNVLSQQYDAVSDIIDNNMTFVKKNGKWACVKYENCFLTEKTPFVFEKVITFRKKNNRCYHFVNAQGTEKWRNWFEDRKIAEVEHCGKRRALTEDMELYGVEQNGCLDFLLQVALLLIFYGAIGFALGYGGSYLYDLFSSDELTVQARLIIAGIVAVLLIYTGYDSGDFSNDPYLVRCKL